VTVATGDHPVDPAAGSDPSSWDEVLAAVEADMLRTQQLLALSAESTVTSDPAGAPAQEMLPATIRQYSQTTWATLPGFDAMPPVPPALSERLHELRTQIVALQVEIKAEMTRWEAECTSRRLPPVPTVGESYYVDRLA
jgi:hypothetical protein